MEIDFLGLTSKDHSSYNLMKNQNSAELNPIIDSGIFPFSIFRISIHKLLLCSNRKFLIKSNQTMFFVFDAI